jgi:putative nucleotidyltransferase with HDIG domain
MSRSDAIRRLFWAAEGLALAGVIAGCALSSSADEWRPLLLLAVLFTLTLVGDRLASSVGGGILSTSHTSIVLAACLLGRTPAVCFALSMAIVKSALRRLPPAAWLNNLTSVPLFAFVGGTMVQLLIGNVHAAANHHLILGVGFGLAVFVVSLVTITINFAVVAIDDAIEEGRSLLRLTREAFIPLMPAHLAAGVLAAVLAVAYTNLGLSALLAAVAVIGTFHYLITALLRSEERADQLEARSIHLANLQVGVLRVLMEALAQRDRTTSEHATTVARYAKGLAVALGLGEEQQEVVNTAALLHDIGKFTWEDRLLRPEQLTDQDWEVIRRHPQDGAALVGKLDGYGAVAEAILYHHERIDGGGYPAGLIGNEIPLASRIISICSTYDAMTASARLGSMLNREDAVVELRKAAGRQLDAELVEAFVEMIEHEAPAPAGDAHEEIEIGFAERARRMAQPITRRVTARS